MAAVGIEGREREDEVDLLREGRELDAPRPPPRPRIDQVQPRDPVVAVLEGGEQGAVRREAQLLHGQSR